MFDLRLHTIVGDENFTSDGKAIAPLFKSPPKPKEISGLTLVRPRSNKEVREILRAAAAEGLKVHTRTDSYLCPKVLELGGILIEFDNMSHIGKIDAKQLTVEIDRGVTYEEFKKAVERGGCQVLLPIAATSPLVAVSNYNRDVLKKAARFPDYHIATMRMALLDGETHYTGAKTLGPKAPNLREDPLPSLSRWYYGSDDVLGVMTYAAIWIYPSREARRFVTAGFDDLAAALETIKIIPRLQYGQEALVLDRRAVKEVCGEEIKTPYLAVIGIEGRRKLVDFQYGKALEFVKEKGGKPDEGREGPIRKAMDEPWQVDFDQHAAFFCRFRNVEKLDALVSEKLGQGRENVSLKITAFGFGSNAYCVYKENGEPSGKMIPLVGDLVRAGAFVSRPQGETARKVYDSAPELKEHIGRIKKMYDPQGILNPANVYY